jgi:hypothetical protein
MTFWFNNKVFKLFASIHQSKFINITKFQEIFEFLSKFHPFLTINPSITDIHAKILIRTSTKLTIFIWSFPQPKVSLQFKAKVETLVAHSLWLLNRNHQFYASSVLNDLFPLEFHQAWTSFLYGFSSLFEADFHYVIINLLINQQNFRWQFSYFKDGTYA